MALLFKADWTSPEWRELLCPCTSQVLTPPCTRQHKTNSFKLYEHFELQPLLLSKVLLCNFAAFLATQHVSVRSIKAYIYGVWHLQILAGLREPFRPLPWPKLEYVFKGIKRFQATQSPHPNASNCQ